MHRAVTQTPTIKNAISAPSSGVRLKGFTENAPYSAGEISISVVHGSAALGVKTSTPLTLVRTTHCAMSCPQENERAAEHDAKAQPEAAPHFRKCRTTVITSAMHTPTAMRVRMRAIGHLDTRHVAGTSADCQPA